VTPKSNDANTINGSSVAASATKTHQAVLKRDSEVLAGESNDSSTFKTLGDDSIATNLSSGPL
jgi:hypothetical protein